MILRCLLVTGALLLTAACSRPPTSALVTVESDIGEELQSVFVEVRNSGSAETAESKSFATAQFGARFSFGVVPLGPLDAQFIVVATAMSCVDCQPDQDATHVLAKVEAIGMFIPETSVQLTLKLSAACRGVICEPGMTCSDRTGSCAPIPVMTGPGSQQTAGDSGSTVVSGRSGAAGVSSQSAGTTGGGASAGRAGANTAGAGGAAQGQAGTSSAPQAGAGGTLNPVQGGTSGHAAGGGAGMAGHEGQAGTSGPLVPTGDRALGDTCQAGTECLSSYCADGVCCQSQCGDSCSACNLPDHVGVCTALDQGAAPSAGHPACNVESQSSCGRDGKCDGAGQCELWKDVACKPASCSAGTNSVTAAAKCDGEGACVAPTAIACAPYTCDASGVACNATCSASVPCATPNPCVSGSCGSKPNGNTCGANSDCTSGFCVDGLCCDKACSGQCEACDLPAAPGTCSAVSSGQPRGGRAACGGSAPCAGACAAASRLTCTFPAAATACRTQSCTGSTLTAAAACDGAGKCPAVSSSACANNLTCNSAGTACLTSCTANSQCTAAAPYCAAGSCTAARPNGTACTANAQCQGSRCVDGFCCNDACSGQCEACDVAGVAGTCTAVSSGPPHTGHTACSGSGSCAGTCSAASRTACSYPGASAQCAAATCADADTAASARFCDGGGSCSAATTTACSAGCSGAACLPPSTCFVAGTPVDTEQGLRPIENIQPGERVRSFDELTGVSAYRKVLVRERRIARGLVRLTLGSGTVLTLSPEHQMWVQETGWVRAALLTLDDSLRSAAGTAIGVSALETLALDARSSEEGIEVFNLLVEGSPTYFVGSEPVLVHSCDYLNFSALDPLDTPQ